MSHASKGEVFVVSPHPDDEIIAPGGTLLRLRNAGFHIVNLAVSLGRPEQHERRRTEVTKACEAAGFDLEVFEPSAQISGGDDMPVSQRYIVERLADLIDERSPKLVVSPSIHDAHHGHEVVARAVRDTLSQPDRNMPWWMHKLWGDSWLPTVYSPFDQEILDKSLDVLNEHAGENARNDYCDYVKGMATANTAILSERVFGWGAERAAEEPYAEGFTEVYNVDGKWLEGEPRVLDINNPFTGPTNYDLSPFVNSPSMYQIIRDHNAGKTRGTMLRPPE
jgi:LmbE family N-acetylglucosaminyl deacetylase